MPNAFQLRRVILPAGAPAGGNCAGLLDDFENGLEGAWSVGRRLLKSYVESLITARRVSDDAEMDIGADSNWRINLASLADFVGDSAWHVKRVYDQSGHGRHLQQDSAAAQPQGGMDEKGQTHAFNPYGDIAVVSLAAEGLSLTIQDTTQWAVGSAAVYAVDLMTLRGESSRRLTNFSNAVILDIPGGGTPFIGGTGTGLYSLAGQFGTTSRLHVGLGTATSGSSAPSDVVSFFSAGNFGGGPNWSQGSRWYAGAVWSADIGNTRVDDLQSRAQSLFLI